MLLVRIMSSGTGSFSPNIDFHSWLHRDPSTILLSRDVDSARSIALDYGNESDASPRPQKAQLECTRSNPKLTVGRASLSHPVHQCNLVLIELEMG